MSLCTEQSKALNPCATGAPDASRDERVLVVDDEEPVRSIFAEYLGETYCCSVAASAEEALVLLSEETYAVVIADMMMPGRNGIELLREVTSRYPDTGVIMVSGVDRTQRVRDAMRLGAFDYLIKPCELDLLGVSVERAVARRSLQLTARKYKQDLERQNIELAARKAELERLRAQIVQAEKMASLGHYETNKQRHELTLANQRLLSRQSEMREGVVHALFEVVKGREKYFAAHSLRVARAALRIACNLNLDKTGLQQLSLAAVLHDIGRIDTRDNALLEVSSPGAEQSAELLTYSERGAKILSFIPDFAEVADLVRSHREHFDGSGWPKGLKADQIPVASRIILVADEYDTLINPRSGANSVPPAKALEIIESGAGAEFDPDVVQALRTYTNGQDDQLKGKNPASSARLGVAGMISPDTRPGVSHFIA